MEDWKISMNNWLIYIRTLVTTNNVVRDLKRVGLNTNLNFEISKHLQFSLSLSLISKACLHFHNASP